MKSTQHGETCSPLRGLAAHLHPPPERRSKRDAAKAFAEAHAKRDPHHKRHTCSTRRRKMEGSSLALPARMFVSLDHRPPISPASTTRRALALRPVNSRWVRSFRRRTSARTAPSVPEQLHLCEQHPGRAEPSQCNGETNVASTASWAPPNNGRPSVDDLQPPPTSCNRHWKVQVAKHVVRRHSGASFAAQSSGSTLDCKSPSPQHPSSGTRSSMMAKGVEKTATTTGTHREEERKTETAQQDHPEKVGFDAGEEVGKAGRKSHASHGPALGAQRGLFVLGKAFHHVTAEKAFHPRRGLMLPTVPRLTGLVIINFMGWWTKASHEGTSKLSTLVNSRLLWKLLSHNRRLRSSSWPHLGVCLKPWTDSQPSWPKKQVDQCETHRANPFRPWPEAGMLLLSLFHRLQHLSG